MALTRTCRTSLCKRLLKFQESGVMYILHIVQVIDGEVEGEWA